jgi:GNAT superfamily N-acetyltransferase
MIGFARVITDYTTFGYLTDVYVLEEHQGKGLGKWLLGCLDEILNAWPELRRFLLLTSEPHAVKLYQNTLGAIDVRESSASLIFMEKIGPVGKTKAS